MQKILSKEIISEELSEGAIINNHHEGFPEDYLVLHCILKSHKNKIKRFLEIGTSKGMGTKIIKNALGDSVVYSLDLPTDLSYLSSDFPEENNMAYFCDLPFIQLRGDSTKFDYEKYFPIDGWFIDAKHSYENVLIESKVAIKSNAKLIIWHDTDITEVYNAIIEAFKGDKDYKLFRVTDTRIVYAVRSN